MLNKKQFYNNLAFRLAAPPLFGVVIYLLILMFFDSVDMLAENFFSREIMFIFGLTYIFFEANRGIIIFLNKTLSSVDSIRLRIIVQYLLSALITLLLVSVILFLYFRFVEGFTTINTELITFNLIYLFTAASYHLYFFSMTFLHKRNDRLVEGELQEKARLQLEFSTFRNQINPGFLFQSLETIISMLHSNKKKADDLVDNLAKIYRYTLDNRHNELVPLIDEAESIEPLLKIYRARYPNALQVDMKIPKSNAFKNVVPGTLQCLLEQAVDSNIVAESLPLSMKIRIKDGKMVVGHNTNQRLQETGKNPRFGFLEKAYGYFNDNGMEVKHNEGFTSFIIPLIEIEEEEAKEIS